MARLKGQGKGKKQNGRNGPTEQELKQNKGRQSRGERKSKGHLLKMRGRKRKGRSVEDMNRKRWQEWRLPCSWIPSLSIWTWNGKKKKKQHSSSASNTNHSCNSHHSEWEAFALTHTAAMKRTTLCILLLTRSFHITSNHSHYSHKPHTLSCVQSVTEGHGTLPQPNTHNHKDHN